MPHSPSEPGRSAASYRMTGALVEDEVTGLVWQREPSPGFVSQYEARQNCQSLSLGGFDDFRLPSAIELITLLDHGSVPTIDSEAFPQTPQDYFWTSSAHPDEEDLAYSVYFGLGETTTGVRDQASAYARCVRGGFRAEEPRWSTTEDGALVHDRTTGLEWTQAVSQTPLSLDSASTHCAELGRQHQGLRLPRSKELQTLVAFTRTDPATFQPFVASTPSGRHWAAQLGDASPLFTDFSEGVTKVATRDELAWVRCVRER